MPESPTMLCCIFMVGCAIMFTPSHAVKFPVTSGTLISKKDARTLGHFVCDLSGESIATSGENVLKQLSQCQHLTPDQIKAIQKILTSGNTSFGPPSKWSSSVLDELGQLILILDPSILQTIPKSVLMPWLKKKFHHSDLPRDQLVRIAESLKSSRQKREAVCPEDRKITEEVLNDGTELLSYTPEELTSCLTEELLRNNLNEILQNPFPHEQLEAIKKKLDELFPTEYPPSVNENFEVLGYLMDENIIKKLTFNSNSLRSLLDSASSDELRIVIIRRYNDLGNQFDGRFLDVLGPYICLLKKEQLDKINEISIKNATTLDPSNCSQATKDNLYPKAKRAFSDQHYKHAEYYKRIKPFIGGAPGEDLRSLSKNGINMDITTFRGLKESSLMELTPNHVKGLLGKNVNSLTEYQNKSPVKEWIQRQKQSDLDSLGLGLQGGLPEGYIVLTKP